MKALQVRKIREGFSLDGTTCEWVRILAGSLHLESFCVEHEDPRLVSAVLDGLGLDSHHNVNYPQAFKRALALQAA